MKRLHGYKDGTPFTSALLDAWGRDLDYDQVQSELEDIGYYVDTVFIGLFYENMNREMEMSQSGKKEMEVRATDLRMD